VGGHASYDSRIDDLILAARYGRPRDYRPLQRADDHIVAGPQTPNITSRHMHFAYTALVAADALANATIKLMGQADIDAISFAPLPSDHLGHCIRDSKLWWRPISCA
jgi:hypothetical protein